LNTVLLTNSINSNVKNKTENDVFSINENSKPFKFILNLDKLNFNEVDESIEEVEEIKKDKSLTILEKETLVLSRIGQGQFRKDLIRLWKTCVISGFDDTRFLIASHIKPWKKADNIERLDKFNGLLLLPTYDKLFDLGYISFEDSGRIIISNTLKNIDKLSISDDITIKIKNENKKYLKFHRDEIFKK
jgi:predicted restriction endonuclease